MKLRRSRILCRLICGVIAYGVLGPFCLAADSATVEVRVVSDEADAVLALLAKKKASQSITEADWQRVFASEGYVRLKKRETAMGRSFEDADFKTFVLSNGLAERAPALASTLARWRRADVTGAARRALAYLPKGARIKAKIYPVIKPRENSFVFDVGTDPAIFLYLDPAISQDKFENNLAHELHHIGYAGSCLSEQKSEEISRLPQNARTVLKWVGAFGEGFAMLAAAGGPQIHPHAVSPPEERVRWDQDVANFNGDLRRVEKFYLDILANRLTDGEEIQQVASSFYGIQGPWYTVGWKMAVTIEKTYGRAKLIECICDQRKLLPTYNKAAAKHNATARAPLALWSSALIEALGDERSKIEKRTITLSDER